MEGFQVEKPTNNQEWDLRLNYQGPKVSQRNCPVVSQRFTIAIYQHVLAIDVRHRQLMQPEVTALLLLAGKAQPTLLKRTLAQALRMTRETKLG